MTASGRIFVAACAALLLGACFGGANPPDFYTLRHASGDAGGAPVASRPDLGLVVGPLELARYLDRPEIVTRGGANALVVSDASRWGGSLRNDVLRVVADDLGRLLGTAQVVTYPSEPRFAARYRVAIDLREFEGTPGESVSLRAIWTIADATGRALAVEETTTAQPTASASYADLVAAQSAALGSMTRAIAERIDALAHSDRTNAATRK